MVRFRWFILPLLALALLSGSARPPRAQPRTAAVQPPPAAAPARPGQPGQPQQPGQPGGGNPEMRIAAVVNDEVISVFDLVSRMRMIMMSSNIPDNVDNERKIAPQILRSLIDERLELQEAKRQSVSASDTEVKAALEHIEKQNNMKPGQLNEFLEARGIEKGTLVDQLTAQIDWAKLVHRKASETVEISDEEIDDSMKRLKEHAKDPESRVAEIFLPVDNPAQDADARSLAERLIQQMKTGARFSEVARQFSKSATAAVGGDLGWIRPDQLPSDLGKQVNQLKVGELSPPIRATGGYYLLLVIERRNGVAGGGEQEEVYDIVQVVLPLPARASEAVRRSALGEVETIRTAAKDCPSLLKIGKEKAPQLSSEGKLSGAEISPQMHTVIDKLSVGQPSEPIVQKNGVGVVMVCSKSNAAAGTGNATRDQVADMLVRQRLDTVARQYLHDLRRDAYVDVRV